MHCSETTYLVVGAGFSGATLARELVTKLDCRVVVLEERAHLAGNCHTERDRTTGVMVHVFGPHIFHTGREDVWNYVNRFGTFVPFVNRVKASNSFGLFSFRSTFTRLISFLVNTFPERGSDIYRLSCRSHDRGAAEFRRAGLEVCRTRTL